MSPTQSTVVGVVANPHHVGADTTFQNIVAFAVIQRVVAEYARQRIVARTAAHLVIGLIVSVQRVVARCPIAIWSSARSAAVPELASSAGTEPNQPIPRVLAHRAV